MNTTHSSILRRTASRLSLALSALLLVLAIFPPVASAHAQVKSSDPANGATVSPGITKLTIIFTEDVSPEQSIARLSGPNGAMTSGVSSAVDRGDRTKMTITTPALQPGKYTISWAAVTENDNGHTNGKLTFTVADSASSTSSGSTTSSSTGSASSSTPATGAGDNSFMALVLVVAVALLLAGGFAFRRRLSKR